MKMSDFFNGPLTLHGGNVFDGPNMVVTNVIVDGKAIVQAVNNHDKLVEALSDLTGAIENHSVDDPEYGAAYIRAQVVLIELEDE